MTREAFIQFVNEKGNDAELDHTGWRSFKKQLLSVGVLEKSRKAVGFHFYSSVQLTQIDSLYGPWLATQLLRDFGEDCEVIVPDHRNVKNMVQEGLAADVRLPGVRFGNSTENDDRIRSFGRRFANFLTRWFGNNNVDAVNVRNTYFNDNGEFVTKYAESRRDPQQRRGLSKEELMAHIRSDGNTFQIAPTAETEGAMPSLNYTILQLLKYNLNVILTGAPGTGKTYTAKKVAKAMVGAIVPEDATEEEKRAAKKAEEERIESVQFHPGYDYSDFVIGMKPVLVSNEGKEVFEDESGRLYTTANNKKDGKPTDFSGTTSVSFVWRDGIFKQFADKAKNDLGNNYVFLIDEINRADLSRVFGELFSLLEGEYRYSKNADGTEVNAKGITLPNGKNFVIPRNLYIIGTMNDIDRSVESMDFALRRRFAWKEVTAEESKKIIKEKTIVESDKTNLLKAMDALNDMIAPQPQSVANEGTGTKDKTEKTLDLRLGSEYQLGGAIFAKLEKYVGKDDDGKPKAADAKGYKELWDNHIENILREYLRGRSNQAEALEALKKAYNTALPNELREEKYRQAEKQDDGGDKDGTGGNND